MAPAAVVAVVMVDLISFSLGLYSPVHLESQLVGSELQTPGWATEAFYSLGRL
jgi:hypothetical protein